MSGDRFGLELDRRTYQRLRHDLLQQVARHQRDDRWGSVALTSLLEALVHDLDAGWSGVEILDSWVDSADQFCLAYRARYLDGLLLGIRGRQGQRGAYLQAVESPKRFGAYFELYLTEPSGVRSFSEPDDHGIRWFVDFDEDGD